MITQKAKRIRKVFCLSRFIDIYRSIRDAGSGRLHAAESSFWTENCSVRFFILSYIILPVSHEKNCRITDGGTLKKSVRVLCGTVNKRMGFLMHF